jgi:hypothetical protein
VCRCAFRTALIHACRGFRSSHCIPVREAIPPRIMNRQYCAGSAAHHDARILSTNRSGGYRSGNRSISGHRRPGQTALRSFGATIMAGAGFHLGAPGEVALRTKGVSDASLSAFQCDDIIGGG